MNTTRKTALVTGANKGLGFETARQLAQQSFTAWLGARDEARGRAAAEQLAPNGDVRYVRIDVTDDDSVQAAVTHISEECGVLDVLGQHFRSSTKTGYVHEQHQHHRPGEHGQRPGRPGARRRQRS